MPDQACCMQRIDFHREKTLQNQINKAIIEIVAQKGRTGVRV